MTSIFIISNVLDVGHDFKYKEKMMERKILSSEPLKHSGSALQLKIAGYRGWVLREYLDKGFDSALGDFLEGGMQLGKAVKSSRHGEVYLMKFRGEILFIKRFPREGIRAGLQSIFKRNKAQKTWYIGRMMRKRGLNTPMPVFCISRRVSPTKREDVVATKGVPGGVSLKDYVRENFKPGNAPISRKRRSIEQLAEFIAKIHRSGIYHGDLTANNILVSAGGETDTVDIQLIDLDAIRSTRWISLRRRIKNLDELGRNFLDLSVVDLLDRARFLRHYLKVYAGDQKRFRPFVEVVQRRTRYRLKRHGQQFYRSDQMKGESEYDGA